jgi:cobyrinic acid a,c-diamide synthase
MKLPRLLIAGTHSGVGKTTVTLALLAVFRSQGRQVQPFKAGPDFIDPGHHKMASGRESRNLDGWMLGSCLNRTTFQSAAQEGDLSIIEGMMGLFDGSSPINEIGSSAEVAKQLNAPVLLVIDGSAMARSAAAMVFGYTHFDPDVKIAGVVFNRIKREGHYQLLKEAVEKGTNVPVVGYIQPNSELTIADRHLGLRTALEGNDPAFYTRLGEAATATLDLEAIAELAEKAQDWEESVVSTRLPTVEVVEKPVRVGVAHDPAFCFYYPENLALLEQAGGNVVYFSPLKDQKLPLGTEVLYLGGGYPEVYATALEQNVSLRSSIAQFIQQGGVVYAECGGLLYLSMSLKGFDGKISEMVGVLPCDAVMSRTQMTLGYRELTLTQTGLLGEKGRRIRGHEFHYSHLENLGDVDYIGRITDAQGKDRGSDGIALSNVVGLYTHLHFASLPQVPVTLLQIARAQRKIRTPSYD